VDEKVTSVNFVDDKMDDFFGMRKLTPINLVADLNGINVLDEKLTSFNFVDDMNR
jgi:hypothetical protein